MANKNLFKSTIGRLLPKTNAVNEAGGPAYRSDPRHALAVYAATGCLNDTFYASADVQLDRVMALCAKVEPEFIARVALFTRERNHMKDLPALLAAALSVRSPGLLAEIFDRVIDSPKMLRNFVQIIRSGVVGRKSLGSLPKRLIVQWLDARTDEQLFVGSIDNDPSMADVLKMVHPKPKSTAREALYGYLLGREYNTDALPEIVRRYEAYKRADDRRELDTPDVPFQMLTALGLDTWEWKGIARLAPWQMTRMNLNTFARHGVFEDGELVRIVSDRLRDPQLIARSRVLPYQLMIAFNMTQGLLPWDISAALQDAMEIAVANVPCVDGRVFVFPDVSGSMQSPITGHRHGSTSAVRCVDIAALVAAAMLRTNPAAMVVPFEAKAIAPEDVGLNPRDSIMTNARKLTSLPCGGTNCSAPLALLNARKARGDLVIYVSDNESWMDSPHYGHWGGSATATMHEWSIFKQRNPQAKMICIDIQPYTTTQAQERDDIFNVAGFSDQVFDLIAAVSSGDASTGYWVNQIEAVSI
ncbi:MAG: TROVE domain-containing protein [Planctomycetes bacterium]|nr:TROVE domain-containing protein [Planctomycetota bacterium]